MPKYCSSGYVISYVDNHTFCTLLIILQNIHTVKSSTSLLGKVIQFSTPNKGDTDIPVARNTRQLTGKKMAAPKRYVDAAAGGKR